MGCYAKIIRQWDDDQTIVFEVGCDSSYPDAVAECVAEVARLDGLLDVNEDETPGE